MHCKMSDSDWDELWQTEEKSVLPPSGLSEQIWHYSGRLGQGKEQQVSLRNGLRLIICDHHLREDVTTTSQHYDGDYPTEAVVSFVVSGTVRTIHHGLTDYIFEVAGKNHLEFAPEGRETEDWAARERILKVRVGIQAEALRAMCGVSKSTLPPELNRLVAAQSVPHSYRLATTTPTMQTIIHQILNCPYQDWTRQFYLESKTQELLMLWFAQVSQSDQLTAPYPFSPDDIECIHQAKDILIHSLQQPPSLLELARQVGLNDRKLKQGFRQVFGTTVFGYLYDYRMQQAHQLLVAGQLTVKETARWVGYASQSSFNAAFKKKFGVNPNTVRKP
jgi:AraC family transcriptional regulator, transcriptional activator of the genes for pyochelin and ferripyochelin receptors